jgi:hypothetical protein
MRKLILSVCVVAASGAYVVQAAMSREDGLQALLDRMMFRPADRGGAPLDLTGPGMSADDLLTRALVTPAEVQPPATVTAAAPG